jgi:hypothetical protein
LWFGEFLLVYQSDTTAKGARSVWERWMAYISILPSNRFLLKITFYFITILLPLFTISPPSPSKKSIICKNEIVPHKYTSSCNGCSPVLRFSYGSITFCLIIGTIFIYDWLNSPVPTLSKTEDGICNHPLTPSFS